MTFITKSHKLIWLVSLIGLLIIISAAPAKAQFYDLKVKVADTTGSSGEQNSVISIFMENWNDTVAAFEFWLRLEQQDIFEFQTSLDTFYDTTWWACSSGGIYPCNDSFEVTDSVLLDTTGTWAGWEWFTDTSFEFIAGNHDVSGTLIEDWQYVSSASIVGGGEGYDLKIVAQANQIAPPYQQGIGDPQTGGTPLIKIMGDIYEIPDTIHGDDRICNLFIERSLDFFSFSDQDGAGIGVITDTIIDTNWYICSLWYFDSCMIWNQIANGPIDSVDSWWCCDTFLNGRMDTANMKIVDGKLRILEVCGDADGSGTNNLLDITFLIAYLYQAGPAPDPLWQGDANSSCSINLLDITYLIGFLYQGGPDPGCVNCME